MVVPASSSSIDSTGRLLPLFVQNRNRNTTSYMNNNNGTSTTTNGRRTNTTIRHNNKIVIVFIMIGTIIVLISLLGPFVLLHIDKHDDTISSSTGNNNININNSNNNAIHNSIRKMQQPRPTVIEVDDLDHEGIFRKVMKSCIPYTYDIKNNNILRTNTKCGIYIPNKIDTTSSSSNTDNDNNNNQSKKKIQRIAILAPPGDLSGSLIHRVENIVNEYNKYRTTMKSIQSQQQQDKQLKVTENDIDNEYPEMELIITTHVPPYGYGKTHGYSKIIRLIPEPLLLEVTDALTSILQPTESYNDLTLYDLQIALRQILRYHCRINHISAHTALLSIKFMDLFADPIGTTQQIRNFILPSSMIQTKSKLISSKTNQQQQQQRKDQENVQVEEIGDEEEEEDEQQSIDDDQSSLMDAELAYGSQILTNIQQYGVDGGRTNVTVGRTIMDILDQILVSEYHKSNDLSKWPCLSFWEPNNSNSNQHNNQNGSPAQQEQQQELSIIVQRLAKKLSPNCNDPYNTCFVQKDICEFNGDYQCLIQSK